MKVKLPQYSGRDYQVLLFIIVPFTLVMNLAIFGALYFTESGLFILSSLITAAAFTLDFMVCSALAVSLKNRFPSEQELTKRLTFIIISLLALTSVFLIALFRGYEAMGIYGYTFNEVGFVWAFFGLGIGNIFITFLMEGISRYENWKGNLLETEELKKSYRQSQLFGLKSQVNPHFLFNSLNSLSSLIGEDEEKAGKFLDEMSKVYRYMLRNEDDQLVSLGVELNFIESYLFLLKTRYGDGLEVNLDIAEEDRDYLLAPLTIQEILENTVTRNVISKTRPLIISVQVNEEKNLVIRNIVQPKVLAETPGVDPGLDNLVTKYLLLNQSEVVISEEGFERTVVIPLITTRQILMV